MSQDDTIRAPSQETLRDLTPLELLSEQAREQGWHVAAEEKGHLLIELLQEEGAYELMVTWIEDERRMHVECNFGPIIYEKEPARRRDCCELIVAFNKAGVGVSSGLKDITPDGALETLCMEALEKIDHENEALELFKMVLDAARRFYIAWQCILNNSFIAKDAAFLVTCEPEGSA